MKCPHCLTSFHSNPQGKSLDVDNEYIWIATHENCPACGRIIVHLIPKAKAPHMLDGPVRLVYPKGVNRSPLSAYVPDPYASDFREACLVFTDSPKASAALSRRCIQAILRDKAGVKHQDLSKEIQAVLDSKQLPSRLAESVDAIRNIGNFAAHPIKSTNTSQIVDVELGEAEWCLDLLEELFDFYFVQPERLRAKRAALDSKLSGAGKPPMKG